MPDQVQPRFHHGAAAAKQRREQRQAAQDADAEQQDLQQTAPPVNTAQPAPVQQPVVQPAPADHNIMFPDVSAQPAPTQPSPRELELERQLQEHRAQMEQLQNQITSQETERTTQSAAQQTELEELRRFREDMEMQQLTSLNGIELETMDPAMAQELASKVLRPLAERMDKRYNERLRTTQDELRRDQEQRAQREAEMSDEQIARQRAKINEAIFAAHPDFNTVRNSEEFAKYAAQAARAGASITLGALMANEYHNGNAEFVIQALNDYKTGRPSLESFASAQVATTASAPASETDEEQYTQEDVAEWNRLRATGEMSATEFKELRAKYKAQRQAGQAAG